MPELLNRFMETSNIAIKPHATRLHRLIILRFLYSFGQSSDVGTCIANLLTSGVDVGVFNQQTTEVCHVVACSHANLSEAMSITHACIVFRIWTNFQSRACLKYERAIDTP